jgi:hypothetical protein
MALLVARRKLNGRAPQRSRQSGRPVNAPTRSESDCGELIGGTLAYTLSASLSV